MVDEREARCKGHHTPPFQPAPQNQEQVLPRIALGGVDSE